ncbi:MAG: ABC transporter permease [Clostridia bacterium]|nr:ABC transporter permease [Clostridia bacterium]
MSENKANNLNKNEEQLALDDGRRVKVLSPGMMVFKRFIRNKLAIAGIIILAFMFLFSFLGGLVSPYRQDQVFYKTDSANKEYASAVVNTEYRFVTRDGSQLSTLVRANFSRVIKDAGEEGVSFEADGAAWTVRMLGDSFYSIGTAQELGTVTMLGKIADVKPNPGMEISDEVKAAALQAVQSGTLEFEVDGQTYLLTKGKAKSYTLGTVAEAAIASLLSFDTYSSDDKALASGYEFRRGAELAMNTGENAFEAAGESFTLGIEDGGALIYRAGEESPMATVSNVIVNSVTSGVFLPMDYKAAVAEAIADHQTAFEYVNADGETERHTIRMRGNNYIIYTEQQTYLIDMYAAPSMAHPLGTDDHGMDVLTRLMYGGRISLMVGFVVMLLENLIGIIIGGISGYFGGWVDTLLMRFVDLFYSIPYYPMMIIAGAIMDAFEVPPYTRIFLLMAIMGIMGWTGVARVVRGQILSLREQDFMVATEATGIRISRRIFRHLVPNVMPLLIVQATMGLGSIILTEATLSFLGLGIKYPLASWGSIINAASNIYVMTNFWYIWIPAGVLIVLTVLGFNFVGDGLRDAFDPKMKR